MPETSLATFLTTLFGGAESGWLNIFTLPDRHSQTYPVSQLHRAYTYIAQQASVQNVYFTVGLLKDPPPKGRGDSALVAWLPALHVDIDILHAAHKKYALPPTMADALSLLRVIPLPPSILLNSGHGLHAYWCLRELWCLDTDEERARAYHLLGQVQATIREAARQKGWTLDSTFDMARVLRLPGTLNHNGGGIPVPVDLMEIWPDRRYNPNEFLPYLIEMDPFSNGNGGLVHLPEDLPANVDVNRLTVSMHIKYLIVDGADRLNPSKYPSRSEALAAVIRALLSKDYDDTTIASILLDPRYKISEKPLEKGRKWLAGELQRLRDKPVPRLVPSRQGEDPPDTTPFDGEQDSSGKDVHLTDVGNGLRLVQQFGQDLRYVITWDKWLSWQKGRWMADIGRSVEWYSKKVISSLYHSAEHQIEALSHNIPADESGRKQHKEVLDRVTATLKWALTSESSNHIDLMVKRARVNPSIQVSHRDLDANPILFQVLNGTIDLTTGTLLEPRRSDLITKQAPVFYDPDAICPRWHRFLQRVQGYPQPYEILTPEERDRRITQADEMITYLKRLVGMCLTADVTAQILLFLYGTGNNGKSTFLNLILTLLGEYGMQAAPNFLLVREHEQHPTELSDLFGKRFVCTIEIEKGKHLAEALMKMLTGGEHVRARRMREDFWEFPPTWKIWFAANDKPKVKGRDKATWRRIKLIPFDVTIPDTEVDRNLSHTLLNELPGILNWAIEGCVEWQAHGLQEPEKVTKATDAYREETDILAQFCRECCTLLSDAKTQSSTLHKAFEAYTGQMVSPVEFADIMKASGFKKSTVHGRVFWLGIGVNSERVGSDGKSRSA